MTIQDVKDHTQAAINALQGIPGNTSSIRNYLNGAMVCIDAYKPPDDTVLVPDTSFWSVMYYDTIQKRWIERYDFTKVKLAIGTLGIKAWITKLSQRGYTDAGVKIICS